MEVKIIKDIREYNESVYFGLSLRQFVFSVGACMISVLLYFLLRNYFNIETLSWICILGASPFAAMGFVKYNGMNFEQFIIAFFKHKVLLPYNLKLKPINYYYENYKNEMKGLEKNENNKFNFKRK